MKASVIVPARNAGTTRARTLGALTRQKVEGEYEVVVVDDGSTHATAELARGAPGAVAVVSQPAAGPAAARNAGAARANGSVLAFCDADVFPVEQWLRAGVEALAHADLLAPPRADAPLVAAGDEHVRQLASEPLGAATDLRPIAGVEQRDAQGGGRHWGRLSPHASGSPLMRDEEKELMQMANELKGKRVAFLFTEGVEQVELTEPLEAIRKAGAEADLISLEKGEVEMWQHFDKGDKIEANLAVSDADAAEYDGLVLPGGVANPDQLRGDEDAVKFVRAFFEQDKPVGVICHGPWLLAEADVARGRRVTSWPSLKTDLRNAGAQWVDEEVVVDNGLVTSRKPDDLPAFCAKIVEEFAEGRHEQRVAA